MIAAAVPDLLTTDQRRSIVEVATDELLTPYGLRTLSPKDPKYIGDYHGDPRTRDGAYHQGTVWPWLLGPYITALVSSSKSQDEGKKKARDALHPLLDNLELYGMGTIPEVFSGDFPHQPGGTISQAWSVAEVIRAWSEDVAGNRRGMKKCL
jgi:glycogen debranching enzyme